MDTLYDIMKKVKDKIDDITHIRSEKCAEISEENEEVEDWYHDVGTCPKEIIKTFEKNGETVHVPSSLMLHIIE